MPGAGGTGGNVSAGEEEGRGRSCQGLRLWSLTVSSGCTEPALLRSAPPRPAAMEASGEGICLPGPCWSLSLRLPSVIVQMDAHSPTGGPLASPAHRPLCSWFLVSVQQRQPRLPPRAEVRLLQKAHHSQHPRVLGRAGTGETGNELSPLLLPCVPTYSSPGLSARILTTLKAPGDIPTPVRMLLQPSRQGQGTSLSSAVSADAPTPALLSPSPRPMGMWARPRESHRCHHAVHRPLTPTLQRPRWSVSGPCPFCSKHRPALWVTHWPLFPGLICVKGARKPLPRGRGWAVLWSLNSWAAVIAASPLV